MFSRLWLWVLMVVVAVPAMAESLLFVAPLRVEFGPKDQINVVTLTNKSEKSKSYKISLLDQMMDEKGVVNNVQGAFAYSAKDMLRFMPRRVDLAPNQRQVVRIMVKRPAGLADGDYHTHMMFEEEDTFKEPVPAVSDTTPPKGLRMIVETHYSLAVPVVVQSGVVSSSAEVHAVSYDPQGSDGAHPAVMVDVTRLGNAESGAFLTARVDGVDVVSPRRLRLYREQDEYRVALPIKKELVGTLSNKEIVVQVSDSFEKDARIIKTLTTHIP